MTRKPLKTELHHWWPRSLQEHWCDADGCLFVVRPDGKVIPSRPGNFGAITNAHHMKIGGPWDATFEPVFNRPDSEMHDLVEWLYTLEVSNADAQGPTLARILDQPLPEERQYQLARATASLMARSPRTRNTLQLTTDYFRGGGPINPEDRNKDDVLVALNQRGLYDAYRNRLEPGGRWAVLFSDVTEFIFGDGFLHNFPASANGIGASRKCLLPFTPTAMIVNMLPVSHPDEPRLVTMRLRPDEVQAINGMVQVYSKEFLFYRSQQPTIDPVFSLGQLRQYKYHQHAWADALLDDLAHYNLWGPGETPSRCAPDRDKFDLDAFMAQYGLDEEP